MPRILYIEDNQDNIYMLSRRLQKKGFEVLIAEDGQSGIEKAIQEIPDIILMDLVLPDIDGWKATRQLKARADTKNIPIIALSASVSTDDIDLAYKAGCDDVDTKPVELERLLDKINNALNI